jgi:hypothetical protein
LNKNLIETLKEKQDELKDLVEKHEDILDSDDSFEIKPKIKS